MVSTGSDGAAVPPAAMRDLADAELIRRIAERRPDALAVLYDRFSPLLHALTRRILGNSADAEEVVQETFVQVWSQAGRYDAKRSSVPTWLVLLARSRAIDLLRSRTVRQRAVAEATADPPPDASPEGPAAVWYGERRSRLAKALAVLPAEQREVVQQAFFGGLSQREIAEANGIPLGTVKTRTLLAMRKLREALGKEMRELL